MVHKVPKWQVSQLSHLPRAEGLSEAYVKSLFQFSIVLIVQVSHHGKEVIGKVFDLGPSLMKGEMLDAAVSLRSHGGKIRRRICPFKLC